MTGGSGSVDVLADHSILLAIPAFLPALLVVAVVILVAVRDRRAEERDAASGSPSEHGGEKEE
ncbi:hypothetical protein ACFZC5_35515 [Nocardia gamkensis]|jgi:hypothetical protein|uniref:hypothetical protein n=1 Tax=Nocardia gamkensis TaxID=352869 RepID=UPI0036EEF425